MPDHTKHEINRLSWNAATERHNRHKGNQARFLRDGGSTLYREEVALLGDVRGKTIVHLQCNAGQDTLSIAAHLGAHVTGVDISDTAIDFARQLSAESGVPGAFVRMDVYDWFAQNSTQYDRVFVTYGALCWLSDIVAWGAGVAAALKPGGHLVLVDFHPLMTMLDDDGECIRWHYGWGSSEQWDDGVGDYVADAGGALTQTGVPVANTAPFRNPHTAIEFAWGTADVIASLLAAGLHLRTFTEYPYCNGFKPFAQMIEVPGRRFTMPEGSPRIPLMYALTAARIEG